MLTDFNIIVNEPYCYRFWNEYLFTLDENIIIKSNDLY